MHCLHAESSPSFPTSTPRCLCYGKACTQLAYLPWPPLNYSVVMGFSKDKYLALRRVEELAISPLLLQHGESPQIIVESHQPSKIKPTWQQVRLVYLCTLWQICSCTRMFCLRPELQHDLNCFLTWRWCQNSSEP